MEVLLIDVPERVQTERFTLRCPRRGDGAVLIAAICESIDALRPWMPWAQSAPLLDESEAYCRRNQARFQLREDLSFLIFEREPDGSEGVLLGATGLHRIDWTLRRFEIGYWRRAGLQGQGIAAEAVRALSRMAFDALAARRVEIRMDDDNLASRKVAERAGFTFEGLLRQDSVTAQGEPRDTRVYARVRRAEEAALPSVPMSSIATASTTVAE
jgi:RimJ/RimL family protein N-acetyltransferase